MEEQPFVDGDPVVDDMRPIEIDRQFEFRHPSVIPTRPDGKILDDLRAAQCKMHAPLRPGPVKIEIFRVRALTGAGCEFGLAQRQRDALTEVAEQDRCIARHE